LKQKPDGMPIVFNTANPLLSLDTPISPIHRFAQRSEKRPGNQNFAPFPGELREADQKFCVT
jgi:hypothetical protein